MTFLAFSRGRGYGLVSEGCMFSQLAECWGQGVEWETSDGPEKELLLARLQVCLG
jgi:hypothetical protein